MKKTLVVSLAAVAVLALGGCSVIASGEAALTIDDGRVIAIVEMCEDADANTVDEVHLLPSDGQLFFLPRPSWSFDATTSARVDLGSVDEFVDHFDDRQMKLEPSTGSAYVGPVYLDEETVGALKTGELLVSSGDDAVILTAEEFEAAVAKTCGVFDY